jgi:hypothetical protein
MLDLPVSALSGPTFTFPRPTDAVSSLLFHVASDLIRDAYRRFLRHLAAAEIDILFEQGIPARKWKGTNIAHLMESREE